MNRLDVGPQAPATSLMTAEHRISNGMKNVRQAANAVANKTSLAATKAGERHGMWRAMNISQ